MDPAQYFLFKTLHLLSAFALFGSLGAILLVSNRPKVAIILHGISLLALLAIGFALLGKPPIRAWWMIKVGIWIFLGAAPFMARKRYLHPMILFFLSLVAAGVAAWLGLTKPF